MPESSVFPDLFHSFQVFTESGFEAVSDQLGVGAVFPVVSAVQEPERDSVALRVREDVLDGLTVFFGELSCSEILDGNIEIGGDLEKNGMEIAERLGNFCMRFFYLMLGSILAMLKITWANLLPIPLI